MCSNLTKQIHLFLLILGWVVCGLFSGVAFLNLPSSSDSLHTLVFVSFTSCVLLSFLGSSPSASWLLLLFLLVSSSDSSSSEGAVLERSPSPGLSALLPGLGWVLPLTSDLWPFSLTHQSRLSTLKCDFLSLLLHCVLIGRGARQEVEEVTEEYLDSVCVSAWTRSSAHRLMPKMSSNYYFDTFIFFRASWMSRIRISFIFIWELSSDAHLIMALVLNLWLL